MVVIKCCVPNCTDKQEVRHRFPYLDEKIYDEWLRRIGNPLLKEEDPIKVHRNRRICGRHFRKDCYVPNSKKLKYGTVPTLFLPVSDLMTQTGLLNSNYELLLY
ncbi:hypothetical protein Trydic_g10519 [Trypoxylus dichotomus]